MKTRTLVAIIYGLTLAAIAVWLLLERQAGARIHQENTALLGRLNEATEKLAANQRLPERTEPSIDNLSNTGAPLAASATSADQELLRLSATGEFRQMMEKDLEGKSADEAAIRAMDEVSNLKSIQVLNRDFQSGDTAVLTAAFENGDQTNTVKLLLKKVGNEWKIAGTGNP